MFIAIFVGVCAIFAFMLVAIWALMLESFGLKGATRWFEAELPQAILMVVAAVTLLLLALAFVLGATGVVEFPN